MFMFNSVTPRCPGPVLQKHAQIITPPPPCGVFVLVWGVYAKCGTVYYGETSPFWSHLSKG